MFGDGVWIEGPTRSQWRLQERWLHEVSRPVVIEIGAGTAIPSVRYFSQETVHRHGGRLIRINPADCSVPTPRDIGIRLGALEALRRLNSADSAEAPCLKTAQFSLNWTAHGCPGNPERFNAPRPNCNQA